MPNILLKRFLIGWSLNIDYKETGGKSNQLFGSQYLLSCSWPWACEECSFGANLNAENDIHLQSQRNPRALVSISCWEQAILPKLTDRVPWETSSPVASWRLTCPCHYHMRGEWTCSNDSPTSLVLRKQQRKEGLQCRPGEFKGVRAGWGDGEHRILKICIKDKEFQFLLCRQIKFPRNF